MPEIIRTIASRLRQFIGDRRRAPRYKVRLAVLASLPGGAERTQRSSVEGYTRDISASGIGLILPAIRIGDRYLVGEERTLRVTLKLPVGTVELLATSVRYERLEEGSPETGYLVGMRIKEMEDSSQTLFEEYLRTLRKG